MTDPIVTHDGWTLDGYVWRRDGEERTAVRPVYRGDGVKRWTAVMPDATLVSSLAARNDLDAAIADAADILRGYIRWSE